MGFTTGGLVNGGVTKYFAISYDTSLSDADGKSVAQGLMNVCDADYSLLAGWFAGTEFKFSLPINVQLEVGDTGGSWNDPADWKNIFGYHPTVTIKATGAARGLEFVRYLIVGEVSEMFMASKDNGWFEPTSLFKSGDEGSKGEGLSRFLSGQLAVQMGVMNGFPDDSIVNQWLTLASRPDYVDSDPDNNGFNEVTGCTTCFIYYLHDQLGYGITDIINAGAPTLGGVYQKLTGQTGGGQTFLDLVNLHYPGTDWDVPSNNIFPVASLKYIDNTTKITEGATGQVYVSLDRRAPADLSLTVSSDDQTVVSVPPTWTIPAGNLDTLMEVTAQAATGAQRQVAIHVKYAGLTLSAPVTVVPGPSVLTGVVRDVVTNARLAGAMVGISDGDQNRPVEMNLLTGSDGSYTTPPLPPNTYQVDASASGYVDSANSVVIKPGVATTTLNFVLTQSLPSMVEGVVSDGSKTPLTGVALTLEADGSATMRYTATSDNEGNYRIPVDHGSYVGGYTLTATLAGYVGASASVTLLNGEDLRQDLVLAQLGMVSGLVTGSGAPVNEADVRAGGLVVASGATGRYQLQLPPGPVTFTVAATAFDPGTATVTVVPGGTVEQDFALTAASASLTGTVYDNDLDNEGPLPGALVVVAGAPAHGEADADGRYTVTRIPAGPARVTASARVYTAQEATFTFTAGQANAEDFYLMKPGPGPKQ